MYDTPIPMINYVMVGITASVLAYATAMDIDDNTNENPDNSTGWAVDSLPGFDNKETSEPEPEPEPVEEPPMPQAEAEVIPETPVPEVEAQLVTELENVPNNHYVIRNHITKNTKKPEITSIINRKLKLYYLLQNK